MFSNYQPFSKETERFELDRAEKAVKIAVLGGADRQFAEALIDSGEIDFYYANAGQGAQVIMEAYAKTYSVLMKWSVLEGTPKA